MKIISPNDSLNESIVLLEIKRDKELNDLKQQFHEVYESLKPINLLKDTFKEITTIPDLDGGIGKTVIGVAARFLVKNIFFRNSYNPLKKIANIALQNIVSSFASNHSDKINALGQKLFHALLSKLKHHKNRNTSE